MNRASWALLVCVLLFGVDAWAQETVEPTAAQQDFNNQGVVQMQQGKMPEAIAFFRSSLSLGELNVTYLNLGRAYFRLGHCLDAREAYDAVSSSPMVNSPSPAEIAGLLERFESDYASECAATIELTCVDNPQVSVAGAAPRACSSAKTWPAKVGKQVVVASYASEKVSVTVTTEAGETAAVDLAPPEVEPEIAAGPEPTDESSLALYGWIATGTGAALIVAAVMYDAFVTGAAVDDLEALEATNEGVAEAETLREEINGHQLNTAIMGGVGVAAVATGVVLLLLPDETEHASIAVGRDYVGVSLGGSW